MRSRLINGLLFLGGVSLLYFGDKSNDTKCAALGGGLLCYCFMQYTYPKKQYPCPKEERYVGEKRAWTELNYILKDKKLDVTTIKNKNGKYVLSQVESINVHFYRFGLTMLNDTKENREIIKQLSFSKDTI
jgi:hypothetical protein